MTRCKEFAEAIATCCPKAWVINYTNPMSICTRTLTRVAPGLKVFGCCHEVFSTQRMLARLAAQYLKIETPTRHEIQVNVLGINHFTWVDRATYQGYDLFELLRHHLEQPGTLRTYTQAEVESWNDWFYSADQVKFALFQRFGILAAAGDRHLVEFLPGFIRSPETLFEACHSEGAFVATEEYCSFEIETLCGVSPERIRDSSLRSCERKSAACKTCAQNDIAKGSR
jgi:alpha-galactosidase